MQTDLSGLTALVTGATAGIGRATALTLADLGATVVVHGRSVERGVDTVARITAVGGEARFLTADLADPADVRRLADSAGEVDILVNNAGIFRFSPTVDVDDHTFTAHIDVNVRAPFLLVQELAPRMAERSSGVVINVSSGSAAVPGQGNGIYGASKAALESLTRIWATEYGPSGVRFNVVAPGPTRTEGTAAFGAGFEAAAASVALRRIAEPEEIADVIAFLATPAAGYVNGAVLSVGGGMPAMGA